MFLEVYLSKWSSHRWSLYNQDEFHATQMSYNPKSLDIYVNRQLGELIESDLPPNANDELHFHSFCVLVTFGIQ